MPRSVRIDIPQPTYQQGFARSPSESAHPELWPNGGIFAPGLGHTGNVTLPNFTGKIGGVFAGTAPGISVSDGRYALDLNGVSPAEHVVITGPRADLGINSYPFTLACWFLTRSLDPVTANCLVSLVDVADGSKNYGIESVRGTNTPAITAINPTFKSASGSTNTLNTGWHHICGSFLGDTEKRLYINGIEEANLTDSVTFNTDTDLVDIGRFGDVTPNEYHDGFIDDVFIYADRGLSAREAYKLWSIKRGGIFQLKPMVLAKATVAAAAGGLPERSYPRGVNRGVMRGAV